MPLKRMSCLDIYDMMCKCVDWDKIDPYSSLEEEFSDSPKDTPNENPDRNEDVKPIIGTIYLLRKRTDKTVCHSSHPMQSTRSDINYAKLDETSDADSPK